MLKMFFEGRISRISWGWNEIDIQTAEMEVPASLPLLFQFQRLKKKNKYQNCSIEGSF